MAKILKATEEFILPTEKSVPSDRLSDYSMLLYGLEKIGKTTFTAEFPDAFHIMCEPGGKALSLFQKKAATWPQVVGWVNAVLRSKRFGNVIIDTADEAYDMCLAHVCKKMGIEHPSDEGYGKGWSAVSDEFTRVFRPLLLSERGTIFVSHAKETEIKRRSGDSSTRIVPTMAGGARRILEPVIDIWGYYCYDKNDKRVLQIVGDEVVSAGHRVREHFLGIKEISMGNSPAEGYRNFVAAFENRLGKKGGSNEAQPVEAKRRVVIKH